MISNSYLTHCSQSTIIGLVKQKIKNKKRKIAIIFLSISLNMCLGCPKELSHQDSSFEYPQHMFWLRNKKNNFQLRILIWGPKHYVLEFTYEYYIHCNSCTYPEGGLGVWTNDPPWKITKL